MDRDDLLRCGVPALVMNAFHLMQRPGSSTVRALGGLHRMAAWPRPIVTDSGGFQAYSLIHQNPRFGEIHTNGITFRPEGSDRRLLLTPEKTIQRQMSYGADVLICLDDCTHVDASEPAQRESVDRTLAWARRCKSEFERLLRQRRLPEVERPLLFAVIQGGGSRDLRRRCASELLEIGFDGFGYGGWPLDAAGNLLIDLLAYTRELVPASYPMHALGVGHPANVAACARAGYALFDSAMPTRDARHGRLYAWTTHEPPGEGNDGFQFVYVGDDRQIKNRAPISPFCDAICCTHYSLGYLHHLYKLGDSLYFRLATIHNLRFMAQLTDRLRDTGDA